MKKLMKMMMVVTLLFTLTACADRIFTNPAGIAQGAAPSVEAYYYEYDLPQPLPIAAPPSYISESNALRLAMRHPLTLNPLLNEDITVARILRLIFEPLVVLDENLSPIGNLTQIEFSTDFSNALLVIRPDAFWSDGTPVTVEDLVFTVDTLRAASPNTIYRQNVENIRSISRINSRTARVYFHNASVCAGVSLGFPLIPHNHYRGNLNAEPLGNGMFLFESHTHMRNLTLVQNPSSFRQLSHLQEVEVIFLPDAQSKIYAFDQGRIDAIYLPLTEWVLHHSVRHPGYEIFPAMCFEFIGFNFDSVFANIHMRQAIAQVFDACAAVYAIYLHHAQRATTAMHPASFMVADINILPYDPTRARALFHAETLRRPIVIIANEDNPQRVSIARRLSQAINAIGFLTRLEILHYDEYFARLDEGDFDLFIGGMTLKNPPDLEVFFSGGFFMECEVLEDAYRHARQAFFNEAQYLQAWAEFQQVFADRLPVISLGFRHSAVLTNARITQGEAPAPDNVFGRVNYWE